MHWKARAHDYAEESKSNEAFVHLSSNQVGHFHLTQIYLNMENVEGMEAQALEYQKIEEVFEDQD